SVLAALGPEGGERWRAGNGPTGARGDAGCWRPLAAPWPAAGRRGLLVRRSLRAPAARTADGVVAPPVTPLATGVPGAGSRWTLARSCAEATGAGGLDH